MSYQPSITDGGRYIGMDMANITLGPLGAKKGFDFSKFGELDFFDYDNNSTPKSSGFKIFEDSRNYTEVKGSGLTYKMDGGEIVGLKSGSVNAITQVTNGKVLFAATDLKLSAVALSNTIDGTATDGLKLLLSGNDKITGTAYADTLFGLAGNDVLIGGLGADKLSGGAGSDTASYANATSGVTASLAAGISGTGEAKGDTYVSIENLVGSKYADKLYGDANANSLSGGSGNDILTGGAGADKLSGGAGNDTLSGGAGADDLYGGAGKDTFVFKALSDSTTTASGRDTIFDFSRADGDKIDLSQIDANSKVAGNNAFAFIGAKAFTGKGGEVRVEKMASDTYIYADVNGDKKADFAIHLDDAVTLTADYFTL
ncbi:calcium-binding protein [Ciceribacter sp. L1K23]|nr:calcium-binding protein [Ciceribacter sp. L1K23]